ncbi:MAG: Eco57I restriction-modification methylase domain-containing protein [Anaerolineales bacterium]|nr:Eco57I restriction-modification methylase domain-containing protein [Anaerolineales bacterium]
MLSNATFNPDVLSCLANLSNDEVFTPPQLANQMLDLLPAEIWQDKNATFLDPACKTGVFLREAAKRLDAGLEQQIPDRQARINHIFTKQLFGLPVTELTALMSRRSLYCSKYADGKYSVADGFADEQGNIRYERIEHTWQNGRCTYCGASEEEYERGEELETHAYRFIHTLKPEEIFDMKFDVIIGNPPYHLSDAGHGISAKPLFQLFVQQAKKLNPSYLSMIIPARWYAGGKGLDDFRDAMLNDKRMKVLVDYESSKDSFDGVNIAGGICYFLWQKSHFGDCEVINVQQTRHYSAMRPLDEFPIFIRANRAVSIVKKVVSTATDTWDNHNYPRNPFGFATNYRGRTKSSSESVRLLSSQGFGFVKRSEVVKNIELIDKYKIIIGRLVPSNGELDVNPADGYRVITNTRILKPGEIHTESYLLIGAFKTLKEAKNFDGFIKLRFPRFLLRQAISSVNVTKDCFRFVPYEDFKESWTDEQLFRKYGLSKDEISYVESVIRPME